MSRGGYHTRDVDGRTAHGLYRDPENGWIFGVCAGLADYLGFGTIAIRIAAIVCLFFFFWAAVIAYFAASLFLKAKPLTWCGSREECDFWRRRTRDDGWRHS